MDIKTLYEKYFSKIEQSGPCTQALGDVLEDYGNMLKQNPNASEKEKSHMMSVARGHYTMKYRVPDFNIIHVIKRIIDKK